ncbi:hypothetical protein SmJEL517_g01514 [Synchytrium microbalum]|uniref:Uncharacterized protein n=1 Tax=Synchytrium microbalum TaxID=1806994 RepID=A0A507C5P8_9FUNG|nr:uncharacterized protein SmJEL517_g01514 [Synchytrium microbalum]TPX36337.1 hypothetical protein SmJEL517_g01514 [Synchytrium microbalum]
MFLPEDLKRCLQRETQADIERQIHKMDADIEVVTNLGHPSSREDVAWAWCAVNTRCLTLYTYTTKRQPKPGSPTLAMMPMLDLFNHSPQAAVEAGLDESNSYVIWTLKHIQANQQVFINYGPHDNPFLLREYGFVAPNNPYDHAVLDSAYDEFRLDNEKPDNLETTNSYLEAVGYRGDYTVSVSAPISYRLLMALRLRCALCCTQIPKEQVNEIFLKVVYGEYDCISPENERMAIGAMRSILVIEKDRVLEGTLRLRQDERVQAQPVRSILETTLNSLDSSITECVNYFS